MNTDKTRMKIVQNGWPPSVRAKICRGENRKAAGQPSA
jgi:hypothetical protein